MDYIKLEQGYWTSIYDDGYTQLLADAREKERYRSIARCILSREPHDSVLDLGCGSGLLSDYLPVGRYTGVDVAENAVREAACQHKGSFVCAAAEVYVPDAAFDVIVFNESLYYLPAPQEVLRRYRAYLTERGRLVVSLYQPPPGHRSHEILENVTQCVRRMPDFRVSETDVAGDALHWKLFSLIPE